jgi:hypothetical protein
VERAGAKRKFSARPAAENAVGDPKHGVLSFTGRPELEDRAPHVPDQVASFRNTAFCSPSRCSLRRVASPHPIGEIDDLDADKIARKSR